MMRQYLIILCISLFAASLDSCQKWETPSTPGSVTILTEPQPAGEPAAEGSRKVTIATTSDWTAVSDQGWLYVTPSSGSKGIQEVVIHFNANTTKKSRTGQITFRCGSRSATFTLSQSK